MSEFTGKPRFPATRIANIVSYIPDDSQSNGPPTLQNPSSPATCTPKSKSPALVSSSQKYGSPFFFVFGAMLQIRAQLIKVSLPWSDFFFWFCSLFSPRTSPLLQQRPTPLNADSPSPTTHLPRTYRSTTRLGNRPTYQALISPTGLPSQGHDHHPNPNPNPTTATATATAPRETSLETGQADSHTAIQVAKRVGGKLSRTSLAFDSERGRPPNLDCLLQERQSSPRPLTPFHHFHHFHHFHLA